MGRYILRRLAGTALTLWVLSMAIFAVLTFIPGDAAIVFLGLHGDLGRSFSGATSVSQDLIQRLPVTLELTALAVLIALVFALPAGIYTARRRSVPSAAVSMVSLVGLSVPNFWLGTMLVLVFAV